MLCMGSSAAHPDRRIAALARTEAGPVVALSARRRQAWRRLGPLAGAGRFERPGGGDLPGRAAGGEHYEGDEPGPRRGEELLRYRVAPIPGAARNARLLARIPRDQPCADRAIGGAGVGLEPVSLLNDQSHLAAPC